MPVHTNYTTEYFIQMDETVDILGLLDDRVGFTSNNEAENQNNSLFEGNHHLEDSKKEDRMNGVKWKVEDDKKPLVYDTNLKSPTFLTMPQTKMEFLKLFGIVFTTILSIVLLYIIFNNKQRGK